MDRDLVHRQTAASAVKHMVLRLCPLFWFNFFFTLPPLLESPSLCLCLLLPLSLSCFLLSVMSLTVTLQSLGVVGLSCEDALIHLLNFLWPNIFETSPHVINAVMEAIEGIRCAVGSAIVLQYVPLSSLCAPSRSVYLPLSVAPLVLPYVSVSSWSFLFAYGWLLLQVCTARSLPSCPQGAGGLLEGLQQSLHWRPGRRAASAAAHRGRRQEPLPPLGAGGVCVRSIKAQAFSVEMEGAVVAAREQGQTTHVRILQSDHS
jgi:hypothetical protein